MCLRMKSVLKRQESIAFRVNYSNNLAPTFFPESNSSNLSYNFPQNASSSISNPKYSVTLSSCGKVKWGSNSSTCFCTFSLRSYGNFLTSFKLGKTLANCSQSVSPIVSLIPLNIFYIHGFSPLFKLEKTRNSLMYCYAVRSFSARIFCAKLKTSSPAENCPATKTISTKYPTSSTESTGYLRHLNQTFYQNYPSEMLNRIAKIAYCWRVARESTKQTDPITFVLNCYICAFPESSTGERYTTRLNAVTKVLICYGVMADCDQYRTSSMPPSPNFSGMNWQLVSRNLLKSTPVSISRRRSKKLYYSSYISFEVYYFFQAFFQEEAEAEADSDSAWFFLRNRLEMIWYRGRIVSTGANSLERENIQQQQQQF